MTKLGSATPVLRIFDEDKAQEFYIDFLGFSIDWQHRFGENFPVYMQVSKGDCLLNLTGHHGDCCPGSAVYIATEGVEDYCQSLLDKDYKHAKPGVQETEWGTRDMSIKDPFGNRLTFSERLADNKS